MDIICQHCKGQFKIPDEKVPKDKAFSLNCPKCKKKITVAPRKKTAAKPQPSQAGPAPQSKKSALVDEVTSGGYDAGDKPFDFIEEGAKTALVCELDPAYKAKIKAALKALGYHITEPTTARETLKQMRFHLFDMIMLNENFDTDTPENNHVLKFLGRMVIATRRKVFVALLTESHRTFDNMAAFAKSVNVIINPKNIDDIEKILSRAVADNEAFYRTFWETMRSTGKI